MSSETNRSRPDGEAAAAALESGRPKGATDARAKRRGGLLAVALYPKPYAWYLFMASLDVIFTYLVIHPDLFVEGFDPEDPDDLLGLTPRGSEVNPLADWILQSWGLAGMAAFKLGIVLLVIGICEIVGRKRFETGHRLASWAVALSAIPVVVALWYMIRELFSYYA